MLRATLELPVTPARRRSLFGRKGGHVRAVGLRDLEARDEAANFLGLAGQRMARGGGLLAMAAFCCVTRVDLSEADGLFLGGGCDLDHEPVEIGHLGGDAAERLTGLSDARRDLLA